MSGQRDIAIVIPARNEAARIEACLTPLLAQMPERLKLHVVVNNSEDSTAARAERLCRDAAVPARISNLTLGPREGVGTARRIGAAQALAEMPGLRYILTTDADCIVAQDWIARNLHHLERSAAVCGNIAPLTGEAAALTARGAGDTPDRTQEHYGPDDLDIEGATLEKRYRALVLAFYRRHAPEPANPLPHHGQAPGASLAFCASAYQSIGGFAPLQCGEDRDIVRRLKGAGFHVAHANDVRVQASLRLSGRAPGGMSDTLRRRLSQQRYRIDSALPPPSWLWHRRDRLPHWPPEGRDYEPLHLDSLPEHIAHLEALLHPETPHAWPIRAAARPASRRKDNGIQELPSFEPDPVPPDVTDTLTSIP
ncbi:glycosyltransferase [Sulfitobacter aestuarii]|uniref:Glycosyltransferase n=1 Tax=Sulfitobacter aestuarii TaxID=2161676 RepID=A0ABW5U5T2_9RHOB